MSKRWFLFIPILILSFLLLYQWGLGRFLEWKISGYLEENFDGRLSYSHVERQGNHLTFHTLAIEDKKGRKIALSELSFAYQISWFTRELTLFISLENGTIGLPKGAALLPSLFFLGDREFPFFTIDLHIDIPHIEIQTSDFTYKSELHGIFGKEKEWTFSLNEGDCFFTTSGKIEAGRQKVEIKARKFACNRLLSLVKKWPRLSSNKLEAELDGELYFEMEDGHPPRVEGELQVAKMNLHLEEAQLSTEKISCRFGNSMNKNGYIPGLGEIVLVEPLFLSLVKEGEETALGSLQGTLRWADLHSFVHTFSLQCKSGSNNGEEWSLSGKSDFFSYHDFLVATKIDVATNRETPSHYELEFLKKPSLKESVSLSCIQGHPNDYTIAQKLFSHLFPDTPSPLWQRGLLNGQFSLQRQAEEWIEFNGTSLTLTDFFFTFPSLELSFQGKEASGFFSFDPRIPELNQAAKFDLQLSQVEIDLFPLRGLGHFTDIDAHFLLKNGKLEAPKAHLSLGGLQGALSLEKEGEAHFSLQGFGRDIAPLMPSGLSELLRKNSADDFLKITLRAHEALRGLECTGKGEILLQGIEKSEFEFGFLVGLRSGFRFSDKELEKRLSFLEKEPSPLIGLSYFAQQWEKELIERPRTLGGFEIRRGWLHFSDFDLAHFFSPYLFKKGEMALSGRAQIDASFDDRYLFVNYTAKDLRLENDAVAITLPQSSQKSYHFIDFASGHDEGRLWLYGGSYLDKDYNLSFTDIEGSVTFVDKKIYLDHLTGFSQSLYLEASVLVDLSDPREGVFDLFLTSNHAMGEISRIREILLQIDPSLLYEELPLEGSIGLRGEGGELAFHFDPEKHFPHDYSWEGSISGTVVDAKMALTSLPLGFFGINFNFDYNREAKNFLITDLSALTMVDGSKNRQNFILQIDEIGLSKNPSQEELLQSLVKGLIRLRLFQGDEEVVSLTAEGCPIKKRGEEMFEWCFDKELPHFGSLFPKELSLTTKGFERLETFRMESSFRLSDIIHELSRFSDTPLFFLTPELLAPLLSLSPLSGDIRVSMEYNGPENLFTFHLFGEELSLGERLYKKMAISGSYKRGKWTLEKCIFDDFDLSLTLERSGKELFIKPFALHIGKSLLAGGEGIFDPELKKFSGKLDLFQTSLEELPSLVPSLPPLTGCFGRILGKGSFTVESQASGLYWEAILFPEIKECTFANQKISIPTPFTLSIGKDRPLAFSNLLCTLNLPNEDLLFPDSTIALALQEGTYDPKQGLFQIQSLAFSSEKNSFDLFLPLLPENMKNYTELLSQIKRVGGISGKMAGTMGSHGKNLLLNFSPGQYRFQGHEIDIEKMALSLEEPACKLLVTLFPQDPLSIEFKTTKETFFPIQAALFSGDASAINLSIMQREGKILLEGKGQTSGLFIDFHGGETEEEDLYAFDGELSFDFDRCKGWFSKINQEKIASLGLGRGYGLKGRAFFDFSQKEDPLYERKMRPNFSFEGSLLGKEAQFKGVLIDHFQGEISLTPEKMEIRNLQGFDPAFLFQIPFIELLFPKELPSTLFIPRIEMVDLRPSLLHRPGEMRLETPTSPFVIEKLVVENLSGPLDPTEEIRGTGSLHFENPRKNNLRNTIFVLPAEILSRIGLDMAALTPVRGTVQFQVANGLVYITKLKDVYSQGKLSKFYLSPTSEKPSTIDSDGNLSLEIKMRQHTLLFKIAELFTFSIRGTIENPIYSTSRGKNGKASLIENGSM